MADSIEEIQADYIAALRAIAPSIRQWWDTLLARDGEDRVWLRWPTGPSSHPRVLAVFREAYFRIENLNRHIRFTFPDADPGDAEGLWGRDETGQAAVFERHVDRLIFDLQALAPDVADLVDGICFVPVGINQAEVPV